MENGSELRDDKEAVIDDNSPHNGNGLVVLGDGLTASPDWVEEKNVDSDLTNKPIDYSNYDKKELVGLLKEAAANNDFKKADELIREIKPLFDEIRQRERVEALIRFKSDGGID